MVQPWVGEDEQVLVFTKGAMRASAEITDSKVELDGDYEDCKPQPNPSCMQMPVHALTPRNLDHAEEAASNFLREGTLVVGKPALVAFFQAVHLQDREMETPEPFTQQQQSIATQAQSILHYFRLLP